MRRKKRYDQFRFLNIDLLRGMKKNIIKYLCFVICLVVSLSVFDKMVSSNVISGKIINEPGFLDRIIYLFAGNKAFDSTVNNIFVLQPAWFVMTIMPAFLVYSYVVSDLEEVGLQILLRERSRVTWWTNKCIWNILSIILMYAITYLVIFIMIVRKGISWSTLFSVHEDICNVIMEISIQQNIERIILLLVLPIFMGIGVSLLQMALSLILNPSIGFIMILAVNVLSAFFDTSYLPGGYTMVIRWSHMNVTNGLNPLMGIIIAFILGVIGIVSGMIYFSKMDIIERNH